MPLGNGFSSPSPLLMVTFYLKSKEEDFSIFGSLCLYCAMVFSGVDNRLRDFRLPYTKPVAIVEN